MLAWKEVCAQAVLKHPNILQYYSAWAEDDHMYIQSEFCNGESNESPYVSHMCSSHIIDRCVNIFSRRKFI